MGLLEKIFGLERKVLGAGFRTFTESAPSFSAWSGEIYQQELTRAAIERFATACSKLKPEIEGNAKPSVNRVIKTRPNQTMTWPTFLKRAAALYDSDGTSFVVPVFARDMETITGFYPLKCEYAEVVESAGNPWVRFTFATGESTALLLDEVCILSKFQVSSDFFGEENCLDKTLALIDAQNQAQDAAIRNGAKIRFIASVPGMVRVEELEAKRKAFLESNFGSDNNGGVMVHDQTFLEVKQVEPQSYTLSTDEMDRIEKNVCNYFGINENVLQANFNEDQWGSYYELKVEPFGIALGEGLTKMCFSQTQMQHGNRIAFSANRLEYATNATKRNMVRDMVDRGIFSINEAREILQMPPVPDGDIRVIRGEYLNAAAVSTMMNVKGGGRMEKNVSDQYGERDIAGDDDIYMDSDEYGVIDVDE